MKKYSVLQTITSIEQIRWNVEASSLEEAIDKVKNSELDEDQIDEQQSFVSDISYEADES